MLFSSRVLIFQVCALRALAPDGGGVGGRVSECFITHMGQALGGQALSAILLVNSQPRAKFSLVFYFMILPITLAVQPVTLNGRLNDEFEGIWKETVVTQMT